MQPLEPLSGLSQREPLPARIHSSSSKSLLLSQLRLTCSWNAEMQTKSSYVKAFMNQPCQQNPYNDNEM